MTTWAYKGDRFGDDTKSMVLAMLDDYDNDRAFDEFVIWLDENWNVSEVLLNMRMDHVTAEDKLNELKGAFADEIRANTRLLVEFGGHVEEE